MATASGCSVSTPASIRWRCSSAARTRAIWRQAARIGADFGYDEINLNVGCPSDRVQDGRFGACLMAEPALVAECVAAMKAAVAIPVTVKCRIGIDDQDPEAALDALARCGGRGRRRRADRARPQGLAEGTCRRRKTATFRRSIMTRVYRLKAALPDAARHHQWRHRQHLPKRRQHLAMSTA